ncbi:MAG: hypothetical protein V1660_00010 [archaeon]
MEKVDYKTIMRRINDAIKESEKSDKHSVIEVILTKEHCGCPSHLAERIRKCYLNDALFSYDINLMKKNGNAYMHFHRNEK